MSIDRYLLAQLQASAAGEGPMALCARANLAEIERVQAMGSKVPWATSRPARSAPRPPAPMPRANVQHDTAPKAQEENTMTKYQEAVSALRALANGRGPEAAKAQRALVELGAQQANAMGPQQSAQATRHSPFAGLLDDAFGLATNVGARHDGTRTILSPPKPSRI